MISSFDRKRETVKGTWRMNGDTLFLKVKARRGGNKSDNLEHETSKYLVTKEGLMNMKKDRMLFKREKP